MLEDAVTRVDAILKMKTELAFPWPLSVRVPVISNVPEAESYVPSVRVVPPSSVPTVEVAVRPAASLYAVTKSALAVVSRPALVFRHAVPEPPPPVYPPLLSYIVPVIISAHVNSVIEAPPVGSKPTSPFTLTLVPVPVTADPARTAKLSVVKRFTLKCDAYAFGGVEEKLVVKTTRGMKTSSNPKIKAVNFPTLSLSLSYPAINVKVAIFHFLFHAKHFILFIITNVNPPIFFARAISTIYKLGLVLLRGSSIVKLVPFFGILETLIFPPCILTI